MSFLTSITSLLARMATLVLPGRRSGSDTELNCDITNDVFNPCNSRRAR